MPRHLIETKRSQNIISSVELENQIKNLDFSRFSVLLVGYGAMGKNYYKALQALGIKDMTLCSNSPNKLLELQNTSIKIITGGYKNISDSSSPATLAIVATPMRELTPAVQHLVELGYQKILCEKPVSLYSEEVKRLSDYVIRKGINVKCAFNRCAYPSLIEARYRIAQEGGITSCTYSFTEFIDRINLELYSGFEKERWGIANSLHVMSMAHQLIGEPKEWKSFHAGQLPWHPSGSVFVGSGLSSQNIPFAFQADWGTTGRWSIEIHTKISSYRFCPLEKLTRRSHVFGDWDPVSVSVSFNQCKDGICEEIVAMLDTSLSQVIPLTTLDEAYRLVKFGEEIFGYKERVHAST